MVKYAAKIGNRAAERKFGMSEKLVRDWQKAEVNPTAMKKTNKAYRGLEARWLELEERIHRWVLEQHTSGRGLLTVQLRLRATCQGDEYKLLCRRGFLVLPLHATQTPLYQSMDTGVSETARRLPSRSRQFP